MARTGNGGMSTKVIRNIKVLECNGGLEFPRKMYRSYLFFAKDVVGWFSM